MPVVREARPIGEVPPGEDSLALLARHPSEQGGTHTEQAVVGRNVWGRQQGAKLRILTRTQVVCYRRIAKHLARSAEYSWLNPLKFIIVGKVVTEPRFVTRLHTVDILSLCHCETGSLV